MNRRNLISQLGTLVGTSVVSDANASEISAKAA